MGGNVAEWFRPLDLISGVPWAQFSILLLYGFVLGSSEWDTPTKKKYCKSIFHEFFETLGVVHKNLSFILFLFQVRRCGNISLPTIFSYLALLVIYNVFCETNVHRLC